ncbi:MAG: lipoyl synthase [Chlamydiales bacterium]|nr:lipoyl synthase [Chlamydiales bacterium]
MVNKEIFSTVPKVSIKGNKLPKNPCLTNGEKVVKVGRFPPWLHRKMPKGPKLFETHNILKKHQLNTVCEEAKCPNLLECYSKKTATFLAMGKECTRSCSFCDIDFNQAPLPLDETEPKRIALAVKDLNLNHVVITMVARDDINDGGALQLFKILEQIKENAPNVTTEVLTSDFAGNKNAWELALKGMPDVFNHNVETVEKLTPFVRHKATYNRSLEFLHFLSEQESGTQVKSGIMVGLGETKEQVFQTIDDLKKAGCSIVTIGQYLQANAKKIRVKEFITPETFKEYENYGLSIGIKDMFCGPFVRSSYHAAEHV